MYSKCRVFQVHVMNVLNFYLLISHNCIRWKKILTKTVQVLAFWQPWLSNNNFYNFYCFDFETWFLTFSLYLQLLVFYFLRREGNYKTLFYKTCSIKYRKSWDFFLNLFLPNKNWNQIFDFTALSFARFT